MAAPVDRRLLAHSRPARVHLALAGALGVCSAALVLAQAALLAYVISSAVMRHASAASLQRSLIALALVLCARALAGAGFELSGRLGAARVMSDVRGRLARRLLVTGPERRPRGLRTGELASTAVQGVDSLESYFAGYLPQLVLAATVPLAVLAYDAAIDPVSAGILAFTIPVLILFMVLIGKGAQAQARARWRALGLLGAHFLDVVQGLATLRAFGRERAQEDTLERVGESYRAETLGTLRIAFLSALVLELCAMLGTALVAATIGIQLVRGSLHLQAGLTVLLLAPELYAPLRGLGAQFHASADAGGAFERITESLEEERRPAPARAATPGPPSPALAPVRLEAVSLAYPGRERPALEHVDLELEPGKVTALVGPSGSGKSTLARLVLGLADPTSGRVSCGERDLRELDREAWRAQVAWVPQSPTLFGGTVAENVALYEPRASTEAIEAAVRDAGAQEFVAALPHGLRTRVGEGARRLSAGQAQRIALARALLARRALLVLDEPSAHLDEDAARRPRRDDRAPRARAHHAPDRAPSAARAHRAAHLRAARGHARRRRAPARAGARRAPRRAAGAQRGGRVSARSAIALAAGAPRSERTRLARSVAFAALAAGAAIALLATSGYLISRAAQRPEVLALMGAIVAVRAFGITRALARYAERLSSHDLALRQLARLRLRFYRALWPLVPAGLQRHSGDLLSRFVADVDTLQDLYPRVLIPALVSLLVIAGASLAAWLMLPAAGIALLASLALTALALPTLSAAAAARSARRQAPARARLASELVEGIDGAAELALAGRSREYERRLADSDARLARIVRGDALASAAASAAGSVLAGAGVLAVLLAGIPAVRSGALSGVLLAALVLLTLAAYDGVLTLGEAARRLRACSTAASRLHELGERAPEVSDPPHPRALPARARGEGALALERVSFAYAGEPPVLLSASLALNEGERVALCGPSGAGKSTIAELLVRFRDPQSGCVTLDGADVRELAQADVRAAVALCAQDCHLFNTSVRENLLLARRDATPELLMRALAAVELDGLVASLPQGLGTLVGQDGELLSGGQRRRLAFARALLSPARFIVLDEPTAHLDRALARRVLDRMLAYARTSGRSRGVLVITHDVDALSRGFDRVLELRAGELRELGARSGRSGAAPLAA